MPFHIKYKEALDNVLRVFCIISYLLARVGLITPAAREVAGRREVAMRQVEEMRRERRAQWMASLSGPGWARQGNCHTLL